MVKRIIKWLADKGLIKLKIVIYNNKGYCPYCISDLEIPKDKSVVFCQSCKTKVYLNYTKSK